MIIKEIIIVKCQNCALTQTFRVYNPSLNMRASLSFDWRKCQFLFATSAICYEVRALYVVTRGKQLVVCLSLARKLSSCVSDWTLRTSDSALSLLYPHATKQFEYSNILCSSSLVDAHILLLKVWLYRILYFKCGGCAEVQCRYEWVSVGF